MKRILYIDPHFSAVSPSMKSLVRALPVVATEFDEVEIWAVECDVEHPKVKWQPLWAPKIWPLRLLWCVMAFHFRAFWRYKVLRHQRPQIIQCTDFYAMFADFIYVHFHFARYRQIIKENSSNIVLSVTKKAFVFLCYFLEKICFRWAKPRIWATVSQSMADRLVREEKKSHVHVLPNAYDPERFNPQVRQKYRNEMRGYWGIASDEVVLGFSALGDFKRKGLPLLLESAQLLEEAGIKTRILIVGPQITDIADAIDLTCYSYPASQVIATGRVSDTERYFSAMDAFIFPSHCESFCLVLMEAAAMGIPIFPAAFDGHEMTLVEGENGALIPWNAAGICQVLLEHMGMIQQHDAPTCLAHGVDDAEFQKRLLMTYRKLINSSCH